MIYRYDGTFPGFLCAVYEAYHDGTSHTEGICAGTAPAGLFSEEKEVASREETALRVGAAFYRNCGRAASQWLYRAFLAEEEGREDVLFTYVREGFRLKRGLYARRAEPWAWTVFQWAQKTGAEAGKLMGLVRFRELAEGLLYAEISPTHDVLPLLAPHFRKRLSGEAWAIHDVRRRRAACWDRHTLFLAEVPERAEDIRNSESEEALQRMWRTYYRHIAVTERHNPDLRRSFMPQKYWRYLPEMQERPGSR